AVYSRYQENNEALRQQTWGRHNQLSIQHPLSRALPFLSFLLDMEPVAMPGDTFMPRVQSPDFGASQRMAVAPGQEETGYFHMATGQSGHPLSPFYRAGHDDWVIGAPSPFLPGKDAYVLQLIPKP
ncbi:MAG: penicillin acylase family protein, partial [Reinekea sp.]|nr:penicillin acylase family protein [Reinekea sp.]